MTTSRPLRLRWGLIKNLKASVLDSMRLENCFNGLCGVTAACPKKCSHWVKQAFEPFGNPRRWRARPIQWRRVAVGNILAGAPNRVIGHMHDDRFPRGSELSDREHQLERRRDAVILEVATIDEAFRGALWIVTSERAIGGDEGKPGAECRRSGQRNVVLVSVRQLFKQVIGFRKQAPISPVGITIGRGELRRDQPSPAID
jgi:hypothetical protein